MLVSSMDPTNASEAARPRKRRNWLPVAVLAFLVGGWWLASSRARPVGPTVGELLAAVERPNHDGVAPDAPTGRTAIDYAHIFSPEGYLYHGTFTDLDGYPQVTWTYDGVPTKRTINRRITADQLGILASGFERLSQFQATDRRAVADLRKYHVITLSTDAHSPRARVALYLVPDPPGSSDVAHWLEHFAVPRVR